MIRTIVARIEGKTTVRSWLRLLGRTITQFPADLALALGYALLSGAVLLSPFRLETWVMAAVALPFLFVLPGFVFLAVLFPRRAKKTDVRADGPLFTLHTRGIDGVERGVLSFGMSLVLVPIIAVGYSLFPIGYSRQAVAGTLLGLVLVAIVVAAIQRARVPADERYELAIKPRLNGARRAVTTVAPADAVLNIVLAVAVVVSLSAVGYAVLDPLDGTRYTEVALMTETDSGDLVAGDYPDEFVRGEPQPVTLSITNREDAPQTYGVVVIVQRVRDNADSPTVVEQRRVDSFDVTAGAGETTQIQHAAQSPISGENLRLAYLVYDGTPPDRPTTDNAYRYVHLWIDVSDPA
jgi:uncharacterized membrane protein